MAILNKARKFISLDKETMFLFAETFIYLGWARILISLPFSKIAPSLGAQMEETTNAVHARKKTELIKVHQAIQIISQHTFWESKCLVKAIAALKMLEKRQIESTLYLGTARDESGKMIAHAWLRSGPYYITGAEGMERFSVVGKFAKYSTD
ncbi:lasso peptide biosynthesis B2 protein [Paenibacillus sp. GP183]|uniref:lasso peptide biosynthesis B2 protein n=1 Tax=Paenibacillus sp. GP183 TaxID=1882751 RepID=UPI000898A5E6|nr:lasso peptide biosynthesis B2 protein [Paenibacillus sp. GP183]SEC07704.1 Transglutaminase-like superfamily protein [Paenibacillus sp. GP183]